MPPVKLKPSDIAVETKKTFIPYINQKFPTLTPRSHLHSTPEKMQIPAEKRSRVRMPRVAVLDGDPVDVALKWQEETRAGQPSGSTRENIWIPVLNVANEREPGGDWESGSLAPEENLCRRSNLVQCLTAPWSPSAGVVSNYPLPLRGGLYSPAVVVYRDGPNKNYGIWPDFKWLPVISVAPVKRPKLDASGENYSFEQEKELMKDKIRTVLRIAAAWNHFDLCVGSFGAGPTFRNPARQLAGMWREILFTEAEFEGVFSNVVFAIESNVSGGAPQKPSDYEVFSQELKADHVYKTSYQ